MIRWFAKNPVAANVLMVSVIILGAWSYFSKITLEVFPSIATDNVIIRVPYRGATPAEVEQGVVTRIEEAIEDVQGIKQVVSTAAENIGTVNAEIDSGYDPREIMDDIKNRIDAISTFPEETERPVYQIAERNREVISLILSGDLSEHELKHFTELIRDDIANKYNITKIESGAVRTYEIGIEISQNNLRAYGLTLEQVANSIRRSSQDIPAGSLKTQAGEILVRTKGQAYSKEDFEKIVIKHTATQSITVGDIATVKDGFEEEPLFARFNGKRCSIIDVFRVGQQDAIEIAGNVKQYVEDSKQWLPANVELNFWRDRSAIIKARLKTLTDSAIQGGILVFIILALFLRISLAAWVCIGIPVSFMGALIFMPAMGISINIISLFAFILVLGIVVDDAIVTGENIFKHIRRGDDPLNASINGTKEVAVPVTFGILTTMVSFLPLGMLGGLRGPLFAQIPAIIIPVLLFSLLESKFVLPSHLRHLKPIDPNKDHGFFTRIQQFTSLGLEKFVKRFYQPILEKSLRHRYISLALFLGFVIVIFSYTKSGRLGFTFFPRVASETARANLRMPLGTDFATTQKHIDAIYNHAKTLQDKYIDPDSNTSVITKIMATYGATGASKSGKSNIGQVVFEVVPPEQRTLEIDTRELASQWRKLIGDIPGAEQLSFRSEIGRGGDPIDVQLNHRDFDVLNKMGEEVKALLKTYDGVFDIADSLEPGKQEIQIKLKPYAEQLGLTEREIGSQVRHAFFGAEAERVQRERDDVRVMVRYPIHERNSTHYLWQMPIITSSGAQVPITEVAEISLGRSYASIKRVDRQRSINITADLDKLKADQGAITKDLIEKVPVIVAKYRGASFQMEGEVKERAEMSGGMRSGLIMVLVLIYILLAIPFKSYLQPFIVMSVIPFGLIGSILGHLIMGMPLSFPSFFGMMALIGIVINDSLVLVDYINKNLGKDILMAVRNAGGARFRAIVLTSLTTFSGLMPLIFEKSTQAQFLIPMAVSLGFGILFATVITLFVVPIHYLIYNDLRVLIGLGPVKPITE